MRTARRSGRSSARWWVAGIGPTERGSDRVEIAFRLLLLLALVAAVPLGILQGIATYHRQGGVSPQQARDHQPVRAEVMSDPPFADVLPPDALADVPVAFTAPDGKPVTATVQVWVTTRAHDHLTLWVSPDGRLTGPPAERPRSLAEAVAAGALTGLTVPVVAWALLGLVHLALDAERSREWQREWGAVEPLWTFRKR